MSNYGDYSQKTSGASELQNIKQQELENPSTLESATINLKVKTATNPVFQENENTTVSPKTKNDTKIYDLNKKIEQADAKIKELKSSDGDPKRIEGLEKLKVKFEQEKFKIEKITTALTQVQEAETKTLEELHVEYAGKREDTQTVATKGEEEVQEATTKSKHITESNVQTEEAEIQEEEVETQKATEISFLGKAENEMQYLYRIVRGIGENDKSIQFVRLKPPDKETGKETALEYIKLLKEQQVVHCRDGNIHYPQGMDFTAEVGDTIPIVNDDGSPVLNDNGTPVGIEVKDLHAMTQEEYKEFKMAFENHIDKTWIQPKIDGNKPEKAKDHSNIGPSVSTQTTKLKDDKPRVKKTDTNRAQHSKTTSEEVQNAKALKNQADIEISRRKTEQKRHTLSVRIKKDYLQYDREKSEEIKEARERLDAMEENIKSGRSKQEIQALEKELIEIENLIKTFGGETNRKLSVKEHGKLKRTKG